MTLLRFALVLIPHTTDVIPSVARNL